MAHPAGESIDGPLRLDFDRRLKLEFHGSRITTDGGLLAYRELDDALGLTDIAGDELVDPRTGKNGQHALTGLFRQSVFGRLGGYEDVNDADRLGRDPAMRWIVGGRAVARSAASTSQMARFETEFLAADENLAALVDLSGQWIDRVHARHPPKAIVLDMDSSVSPIHGDQEGSAYNGHFACTCYHPLFVFNQNAAHFVRATSTAPMDGAAFWSPSLSVTGNGTCAATSEAMRRSHHPISMSFWRPRATSTRSVSRPTRSFSKASPTS
jgi:hypothetical protein